MTMIFKDLEKKYIKRQDTLMKLLNKRQISQNDQNQEGQIDPRQLLLKASQL